GAYTYPPPGQAQPHAVIAAGAQTYAYDANGSMVSGAGRNIAWDGDNRPAAISDAVATSTFFYDGDGARLKKVVGGTTTIYFGDDVEETNGVMTKSITLSGFVVAQRVGFGPTSTTTWVHTDRQGSVEALTDAGGTEIQRMVYRPWGDRLKTTTGVSASR